MRSFSHLPHGIITDIFSRLPVESVGRCRCVSKPWQSLLSQPEFIRNHLNRSRNNVKEVLSFVSYNQDHRGSLFYAPLESAHQVFDEITISAKKVSFPGYPDCWTEVYGSCDGLLLLGSVTSEMFVLNPTTREIRDVPPSPLGFEPIDYFTLFGFGDDSVNHDYKIVTLSFYDKVCSETFVNVYSLKTGTWKSVESPFYRHHYTPLIPGVLVNGSLHWIVYERRTPDYEPTIVAFDLSEEKFRRVPPPNSVDDMHLFHLVALGGHLCIFYAEEMNIWVMKEYGISESWTRFTLDDLDAFAFMPLCMLEQEEVVLLKDVKELIVRNLRDGTEKMIVHDTRFLHAEGSFVQSLVSPHGPW